jgi:hypothetical protein
MWTMRQTGAVILRIIVISRSNAGHRGGTRALAAAPERRRKEQAVARTCLSVPSTDRGMCVRFGPTPSVG